MKRFALLLACCWVLSGHAQQAPLKVSPLKLPNPGIVAPSSTGAQAGQAGQNANQAQEPITNQQANPNQAQDPNQAPNANTIPANNSLPALQNAPLPGVSKPTDTSRRTVPLGNVGPTHPDRISASPGLRTAGAATGMPIEYAPDSVEPGELLILLSSAEKSAALAEIRLAYPGVAVSSIPLGNFNLELLKLVFSEPDKARIAGAQLQQSRPAWTVTPNALYEPLQSPRLYAANMIVPSGVRHPVALPSVRIGLLDTPVANHPALDKSVIARRSFVPDNERAAPGHATAIAALVAGEAKSSGFFGLISGVHFLSAEIIRQRGARSSTNTELMARGLDWLIGEQAQVINVSIGGPGDRILARLFDSTSLKTTIVVAAAGNSGRDAPPVYPAAYAGIIAVTALDASGRVYTRANQGSYIALAAPGVDVWVPTEGANGAYMTGTSFAAAFVTAAAAHLKAQNKALGGAEIRAALCQDAKDWGTAGVDPIYGCGLLQFAARRN